jgi:hypothetical protein
MSRKSNNPVLVSITGLIGVLGIAWGCDGLIHFLYYLGVETFLLNYVILWAYALIALVLAAIWLLLAWFVLIQAPRNTWVSMVFLLSGLFIVAYPALYYTPALCCGLPDIAAIQLAPTMYLYSSGGCVAIIGLAGLVWTRKKENR